MAALARHSDEVLGVFLAMAGREELLVAVKVAVAAPPIADLPDAVRRFGEDQGN